MLNRVVLVGRLTKDPDLRYTPAGHAVANFTLAVNRPFKSQDGEQQADFINMVVWRKAAENLANYMQKGSQIGVDGRIATRTYEGNDGKTVYVTEVVAESIQFLESRNKQDGQTNNQSQQSNYQAPKQPQQNQQQSNPFQGQGEQISIQDDDLPF